MAEQIIFFSIIIGFIILTIFAHHNLKCPDCDGKLVNTGVHREIMSGTHIYKCTECKEEWI